MNPHIAEHPCATCAGLQKTCCQRAEIVITEGDRARIARFTGRTGFATRLAPERAAYAEADPDDPNWQRWTIAEDGTRAVLRRRPAGDCSFLGAAGCTLPEDVRPLVCRLYPWSYTERGLQGLDDEYCPKQALLPRDQPGATMLTVLGMDPVVGERWRRMLYEELRTREESHESRADLRPA